ncbi:hypothetical protein DH86_00000332 [Scytalidium sp. 3C]|nr:hypothetical protein DH86_00000332 [Scytalidium sp. 3C]
MSPPEILKLDLGDGAQVAKVFDEVKYVTSSYPASSRRSLLVVLTTELAVRRSNANVYNTWDAGAANRFPDKCDADPEGTKALNVTASGTLARLCASASIFLLYISTDYVFPGAPGDAPYENNAQPKPTNLYGETKLEGEKAVLAEYEKAGKAGWGAVLRVPVLYGEAEKPEESAVNTLMSSVWKAQEVKGEGSKIKMDHWAFRYPTNTEDVGRVCQDIATKYLETEDKRSLPTVLQFSSEDRYTKYEICELFAEIMGLPLDGMEPNTQGNDPNSKTQRPYDCHLSTKALKELGINVATQDFKAWWRLQQRAYRK